MSDPRTICHLRFSEIQQSLPCAWQDNNCRLLLVPPTSLIATEHAQSSAGNGVTSMQDYQDETTSPCIPDKILQEVTSFVSKGS